MSAWALACAGASLAGLLAAQVRRLAQARAMLRDAPPAFTRPQAGAQERVLLVGDSTGAGVGCERADDSIAAALAADHPRAEVRNLCVAGARVADVLAAVRRLPAGERFDLVLVFAGGNDVLRCTPSARLERDATALLEELRTRSRRTVWAGMANVGLAPLFLPPFSWLLSARTRAVTRRLARCAAAAGVRYVDFFRPRASDPFSAEPARYYARDRVHPSAAAYAWCYARMRPWIAAALAPVRRRRPA